MRVALLSRGAHPLHEPGGLERAVYHLARHLQRRGVETVLVTRPATRAGAFPGDVVTVPYGRLPLLPHGRVLERTLLYPRFSRRVGEAVAAMVRGGRVQVVDAQGITALGYGRLRLRDPALRAPLLMNPQGMEEHQARGWKRLALGPLRAASREAAALADRVVATDTHTVPEVTRLLGVPPARVVLLPNGVDLEELAEVTPPGGRAAAEALFPALREADPVFLSVGRLEEYKGFGDTLHALTALHRDGALPPGWRWVVAGTGPFADALRADPGLEPHVLLPGRVDEGTLHALYARADVFVHVPHFEGSSLVTLEAMAHGLPVVGSLAGGIPDKVMPGLTGHLVPPRDHAALVSALRALAHDPRGRRELGQAGRQRVQAEFSCETLVTRTLRVYEELLSGGGR